MIWIGIFIINNTAVNSEFCLWSELAMAFNNKTANVPRFRKVEIKKYAKPNTPINIGLLNIRYNKNKNVPKPKLRIAMSFPNLLILDAFIRAKLLKILAFMIIF